MWVITIIIIIIIIIECSVNVLAFFVKFNYFNVQTGHKMLTW